MHHRGLYYDEDRFDGRDRDRPLLPAHHHSNYLDFAPSRFHPPSLLPPTEPAELSRLARPQSAPLYFILREQGSRSPSPPPTFSLRSPQAPTTPLTQLSAAPVPGWWAGSPFAVDGPPHLHPKQFFDDTYLSQLRKPAPRHPGFPPADTLDAERPAWPHVSCPEPRYAVPETPRVVEETFTGDLMEADIVRQHLATFRSRFPDSKHERILLSLIRPKSSGADFILDEQALESIFSAVNEMFFNGQLTNRVQWEWSQEDSSPEFDGRIVGHTSFRHCLGGDGLETLVTLSTPILRDRKYNRRLLISAFIHELIHCYLFILRDKEAKRCNGHTAGFKEIANIIDGWAGRNNQLYLYEMQADLENFREWNRAERGDDDIDEPASGLGAYGRYHDFYCPAVIDDARQQRIYDRWDNLEHSRGRPGVRGGSQYVY